MAGRIRRLSPPIGWDLKLIEEQKLFIKQYLDTHSDPNIPHSRHDLILKQLQALAEDESDLGRLKRYIYAISALVHHEKVGGLTDRDVSRLVELTYAILEAQGVRPRTSKFASLYSDIHLIKSQIERKKGLPWQAAWEQQLALQLAGDLPSGGLGFQRFGMGNRALRLGHTKLALSRFDEAEAAGLKDVLLIRSHLGRMHALWLSGRSIEAGAIAQLILSKTETPRDICREVEWFNLILQFQETGDLLPMLKAIRHNGNHYEATYIIETCFWGYTLESRRFLPQLPRLEHLRRNKKLLPQRLNFWYESAVLMQECYDHQIPLQLRLQKLSRILENRERLLTVDKEILILAASTRWLARCKSHDLALLVYSEYCALNHRLTNGATSDSLKLLADVSSREWINAA